MDEIFLFCAIAYHASHETCISKRLPGGKSDALAEDSVSLISNLHSRTTAPGAVERWVSYPNSELFYIFDG